MNYLEILNNINNRFVLLKLNGIHYIIDKSNNNSILIISDPIINFRALIKEMLKKKVYVYNNFEDIIQDNIDTPSNILFYKEGKIFNTRQEEVRTLKLVQRKIFNQNNNETGCVISAITNTHVSKEDKKRIEKKIEHFAFHNLYPNTGLNIYSATYQDTISLVIIKDINSIAYQELEPIEKTIIDW